MVGPDLKMMQKHVGQIRPAQIELETRVLAKLPVDAEVEYEADNKEAVLASNAQATEIPGLDLSALTAEQKTLALNRLNEEPCACGCGLTIAQCRINDSTCAVSPKLAAADRRRGDGGQVGRVAVITLHEQQLQLRFSSSPRSGSSSHPPATARLAPPTERASPTAREPRSRAWSRTDPLDPRILIQSPDSLHRRLVE